MADFQFISFYIGENLFGLNIFHVREIIHRFEVTPVQGTIDFISGVLNLRGQIVTVLNPKVKLDIPSEEKESNCIVLKTTQELKKTRKNGLMEDNTSTDWVGLLVGQMGDVITVKEENISSPPANLKTIDNKFVAGVVNLDKTLLILLRISEIVASQN